MIHPIGLTQGHYWKGEETSALAGAAAGPGNGAPVAASSLLSLKLSEEAQLRWLSRRSHLLYQLHSKHLLLPRTQKT